MHDVAHGREEHTLLILVQGNFKRKSYSVHVGIVELEKVLLLLDVLFVLLSFLLPEGLKKIRNPDRMYRSAVCYAGHVPPKGVGDDKEMNSKSLLLILHLWYCSKGTLAG